MRQAEQAQTARVPPEAIQAASVLTVKSTGGGRVVQCRGGHWACRDRPLIATVHRISSRSDIKVADDVVAELNRVSEMG